MTEGLLVPLLSMEGPRIVIEIHNSQPIDLLDFTGSLTALAREHEAALKRERPGLAAEESRLLVVDIRRGSIVLELVAALAPFVSQAELINTSVDFVRNIGDALSLLRQPGGRLPDATTQRLKNLNDTVRAIANDSSGKMDIYARHQDGDVLQEFAVQRSEAVTIQQNIAAQRKEIEHQSNEPLRPVLMRLHQSSIEDLKVGKRTAEKGVVERIDLAPRTLIYVSDLAGQTIKSAILAHEGNPFQKAFVVDVDVEYVNGRARAYRVLNVYDVIDLEDE